MGGEECSLELWPVLLQVRDSESACGHSMCVHTDTWDEKPQITKWVWNSGFTNAASAI